MPSPKPHQVRIKVEYSAVTGSDTLIRALETPIPQKIMTQIFLGFNKPRKPITGLIFSGIIDSCGTKIQRFKQGDRVFGFSGYSLGAHAEYLCLKEEGSRTACIALIPEGVSMKEAAAICYGGNIGVHFVNKGEIKQDDRVLIYGASGSLGTTAVQLAKYYGAKVTGVCSSRNLELVKSLGADKVIDYTREDFTTLNDQYDFILDATPFGCINRKQLKRKAQRVLSSKGKYITIVDDNPKIRTDELNFLSDLCKQGRFRAVIDRVYSLEEIVEAHRYVDTRRKRGNVLIAVN